MIGRDVIGKMVSSANHLDSIVVGLASLGAHQGTNGCFGRMNGHVKCKRPPHPPRRRERNQGRRRDGLRAAEHRIEEPLSPCAFYAWTVRARFKLDGRPRAVEWTGDYLFAPWKVRRGLLLPGEQSVQDRWIDWLLFRAPTGVGSTVCAD